LYAERRPLYLAAQVTIQTSGKSVDDVVKEIERWLEGKFSQRNWRRE
jgi:hypothetical protein